ncbi:MAG: hypothetical protein K2H02_00230 [Anaeroplasmataceae bacterium]|nr:hypothetical protein [Anaeroplasmataceae bacterium]MDE5867351.1 hypothetical protein [Anaeroplasmataceae bacterium]
MAFQNRQGSNLNRRKLTVISQTTVNGKTVMLVDVERADSAFIQGTQLTAESLNREIIDLIKKNGGASGTTAETKCVCDRSSSVATTQFVWDVLMALGLTKINHNHSDYSGSTGSDGT